MRWPLPFGALSCGQWVANITWFVGLCSPHTCVAGEQWSTSLPPSPWLPHPSVQIHRDDSLQKARGWSASLCLGATHATQAELQCHSAETPDTQQWAPSYLSSKDLKNKTNKMKMYYSSITNNMTILCKLLLHARYLSTFLHWSLPTTLRC